MTLLAKSFKDGPFTPEEDTIVSQKVAEWGDKPNGLWAGLERVLCRDRVDIKERWEELQQKGNL
eukprot:gene525-701_t